MKRNTNEIHSCIIYIVYGYVHEFSNIKVQWSVIITVDCSVQDLVTIIQESWRCLFSLFTSEKLSGVVVL